MSKVAHVFFEISMANGHTGLIEILKKRAKIVKLNEGETAIFINKKWSALKLLTSEDILLHLRRPANKPILPESIKYLPACVQGSELNYSVALKKTLEDKFKDRK